MPKKTSYLSLLAKLFLGLLGIYTISRLLFYFFNFSHFEDLAFSHLLYILFAGLRFDISVLVLLNFLFIVLFLLPFSVREKRWYGHILKWLFIVVNSIGILANCIDLGYFPFTLKRTTADVFHFISGEIGNDLGNLLPLFLKGYWYIVLIWIILTATLVLFYSITVKQKNLIYDKNRFGKAIQRLVIAVVLSIIGYRGGFQLKPISIISAGEYTSVKYIPVVINTPFAIVKTIGVETIEPKVFFSSESDILKYYNPLHHPSKEEFKKHNVIIIALESFSKEYIGALNGKQKKCTPFLDSLISQSLTFSNAFSNGKKSIEGIPSIVAGIPTWMNEAYITSPYGSNQINSLAGLLKQEGYYTAFFHGGTNGTMGFDAFARLAGYTDYFGRREYNNEEDFDGNWGIWDEEFLQFAANTLNAKPTPFHATIFTLTSHHPYAVPEKYKNSFKEGAYPIEKSISYTDYSLKLFFETAKKMPWYENTLFVLCADHTGISTDAFYTNRVGNYAIPILYFMPGNNSLKGIDSTITQQIDILPSVLDYLDYPKTYFAFGTSVFDSTAEHCALSYQNNLFQFVENNYSMQFDGEKANDLYDFQKDSLLKNNLIEKESVLSKKLENKVKAIIQTYHNSLINNKMQPSTK